MGPHCWAPRFEGERECSMAVRNRALRAWSSAKARLLLAPVRRTAPPCAPDSSRGLHPNSINLIYGRRFRSHLFSRPSHGTRRLNSKSSLDSPPLMKSSSSAHTSWKGNCRRVKPCARYFVKTMVLHTGHFRFDCTRCVWGSAILTRQRLGHFSST